MSQNTIRQCRWINLAQVLGCAVCGMLTAGGSSNAAAGEDHPYGAIFLRNVFDIRPLPVVNPVTPEPVKPPLGIKLTGLTTLFGRPRALFMVRDATPPGKPGTTPAAEESVILSLGERQGGLELLEVDERAGTAKIRNDGDVVELTLPNGPLSGGAGPSAGGPPGSFPGSHPEGGPARPPQGAFPNRPASAEEAAVLLEANRMAAPPNSNRPPLPPPAPGMAALLDRK